MPPSPTAKAPSLSATAERIHQLDVLRGVALLGILIMNMISFGLPGVHYLNPTAEGPLEGLDHIAFLFSEVFASEKFMGLFSVLFGAGSGARGNPKPPGITAGTFGCCCSVSPTPTCSGAGTSW